jgi:hypothetical protein
VNLPMLIEALLVFVGGVMTTWPHREAAIAHELVRPLRRMADDSSMGELTALAQRLARQIEADARPTLRQWRRQSLAGVALGLGGALLMSLATA